MGAAYRYSPKSCGSASQTALVSSYGVEPETLSSGFLIARRGARAVVLNGLIIVGGLDGKRHHGIGLSHSGAQIEGTDSIVGNGAAAPKERARSQPD